MCNKLRQRAIKKTLNILYLLILYICVCMHQLSFVNFVFWYGITIVSNPYRMVYAFGYDFGFRQVWRAQKAKKA